jgi:hypothetical protein
MKRVVIRRTRNIPVFKGRVKLKITYSPSTTREFSVGSHEISESSFHVPNCSVVLRRKNFCIHVSRMLSSKYTRDTYAKDIGSVVERQHDVRSDHRTVVIESYGEPAHCFLPHGEGDSFVITKEQISTNQLQNNQNLLENVCESRRTNLPALISIR